MAPIGLKNLCSPAKLYLVISMVTLFIISFFNFGNENVYCVGYYSCPVTSIYLVFILQIIYILFWTWILNLICKDGYPLISWLLVLVPVLLFFLLIGLFMIHSPVVQGI